MFWELIFLIWGCYRDRNGIPNFFFRRVQWEFKFEIKYNKENTKILSYFSFEKDRANKGKPLCDLFDDPRYKPACPSRDFHPGEEYVKIFKVITGYKHIGDVIDCARRYHSTGEPEIDHFITDDEKQVKLLLQYPKTLNVKLTMITDPVLFCFIHTDLLETYYSSKRRISVPLKMHVQLGLSVQRLYAYEREHLFYCRLLINLSYACASRKSFKFVDRVVEAIFKKKDGDYSVFGVFVSYHYRRLSLLPPELRKYSRQEINLISALPDRLD